MAPITPGFWVDRPLFTAINISAAVDPDPGEKNCKIIEEMKGNWYLLYFFVI